MPGISDLLDSDLEGNDYLNENSLISSASDVTTLAPNKQTGVKKPRKRKCVTMPKKSRATKGTSATESTQTGRPVASKKRKAGADEVEEETKPAMQTTSAMSDNEDEGDLRSKSRGRPVGKGKTLKKLPVEELAEEDGMETEQSPAFARSSHAPSRLPTSVPKVINSQKPSKQAKSKHQQLQETQPETVNEDNSEAENEFAVRQPPAKRARTESRIRQEPMYRRRAGSASDTERGDPNLRRKLGDVTRKFENVDLKYRNLKEVGLVEASANVERLRKQCEATTEASNKLVASLRKELAMQAPLVQESRQLKKELQTHEAEMTQLRSAHSELTASLTSAKNEIKALQAKLAAARSSSVVSETKRASSPVKSIVPTRTVMVGNAESTAVAQLAQLKIDLYGDLTGLIIRNVKRAEDGDTYDCIQTGRNGTLHFKLFIDQEDAKTASFEETEFLYTPLLDANRDRDLIEILPAYLTEDITFARQNAAKFYGRVVDTLTKRRTDD